VLCSLVFFVLFGVWSLDHRVKFFSFHFTFSSPFFTLTLFFLFFSLLLLSFEPHVLLPCLTTSLYYFKALSCYLKLLPYRLAMPCTTSNYYPVISSYYLDLLPCHLVVLHATSNYQATSNYRTIELPNHLKPPFTTSALLPHCLYLLLPFATWLPRTTSHYLYLVVSLPLALVAFSSCCLLLPRYLELPHTTSLPSYFAVLHCLVAIAPQVALDPPHPFVDSMFHYLATLCVVTSLPCYLVLVGTSLLLPLLQGGAWRNELSNN